MIRLTPDQYRRLFIALTAAFSLARLERMLMFNVGKDLAMEAGGKDYEEVVYSLIGKAQRNGWLPELIAGARADNDTPALQQIAAELAPQLAAAAVDHFNVTIVDNNLAFINRSVLRDYLRKLADLQPAGARVLVVNGPPSSGKTYSVELIAYLRRALNNFKFVHIDLKKISGEVRPEHLARDIVDQMYLDQGIIPELNQEQDSRWVQLFCNRLQGVLSNAPEQWWIVIDGFNHARLSTSVNDLVKELSGRRLTLPELRVVLLSYPDALSPDVERVALRETIAPIDEKHLIGFFGQVYYDNKQTYFPKDIAERIGEVLRAADPKSANFLETLGTEVVKVAKQITA